MISRKWLMAVVLCLCITGAHAQTDTLFWFAAPEVSEDLPNILDRPIVVRMTTGALPATVTISQPAGGGMPPQTVTIPANTTQSVDLTTWIDDIENKPPNTVLNMGLKIQSTAPISAYYHVVSTTCACNPEIFVLKGRNATGTDFWIPGQNYYDNSSSYTPLPYNSFDIVATEDGTTVTINPIKDVVGHSAGTSYTVSLNAGQTYSATAASELAADHLQGSRVTSDKPIAITVTDDLLNNGACNDLTGDQIVPTNILGTDYIAMNGALYMGDMLFVTATVDGTNVSQNGSLVGTINAGQTMQLTVGTSSTYVQTSQPAYVWQTSGVGCEMGSAILPQIICTGSSSVSFTQSSIEQLYVNVTVKHGGEGDFLVNGAAGVINASAFSPVAGTSGTWYAAQIPLSTTTYGVGTVLKVTNSTHLFHLGLLNGGFGSGASFGFFSDYGGIAPNAWTLTPKICVGSDIHLHVDTFVAGSYSWVGPGGFASTLQDPVITGATFADSGTYTVTVNVDGCVGTASLHIDVVGPPTGLSITDSIVNCKEVVLGIDNTGGDTIATYSWTYGDGHSGTGVPTSHTYSTTGSYTVAVVAVDTNGCSDTLSKGIDVGHDVNIKATGDTTICAGQSVQLTATGDTGLSYTWTPPVQLNNANIADPIATPTTTITYTVIGNAGNGCLTTDSVQVQVKPANPLTITQSGVVDCNNGTVQLTATGAVKYFWSPAGLCDNPDISNPNVSPTENTTFFVTATDAHGCVATDSVQVQVNKDGYIAMPNAFTPNNDGLNDKIYPLTFCGFVLESFSVYNRWGQRVFYTTKYEDGWDGTFNNVAQPLDVFCYYILGHTQNSDKQQMFKGNITLVR